MTSDQYILAITAIQNRLYAYILSLLADPVAAQDVLQETNLVLIRKADDFQIDASFESWAYNTARFQVLAHLRNRKRDRLVLHEAFAEKLAPVAEVMAEETQRKIQLLGGCVERLSDEHKTLLQKRYGTETSIAALAADRGKTASAMKQVLYRIRHLLAECVEKRLQKGAAG
ncbi:MAG: sigma-70 family RNA polymerase sigma factor [Rubripirellula sp.]|nr:sigma-70 family RNA polymerase sigma factor [Rubripirellula sp.]